MLQKLQQHIIENFSFLHDKKLLIAISGGVDSVVLMHLLQLLNFDVTLAHCNFQLRNKESDKDEEFVNNLGKKLNIEVFTTKFDTEEFASENKLSTQVAARNLRYTWFNELLEKHQFDYVVTAHHADDNLETFLINLTRGTGLEGLTGIPAINGKTVRPLLIFSRDEIVAYAKKNSIDWREDKSNASSKYLRNKIRHQIVPILKEINPSLIASFSKTTTFLQESQQIIDDRVEAISKNICINNDLSTAPVCRTGRLEETNTTLKIDIQKLQKLSNPKAYLYQLLKKYHFTEWNDVAHLINAQSGKQVVSKSHRLLKDRDFLLLSTLDKNISLRAVETFFIKENMAKITVPIHLLLTNTSEKPIKNKHSIYIDKDLLKYPLCVRKWQKEDYFYPSGMQGKKKLSKYFKDEKLSLLEKENSWLLCNATKDIIWIIGKRQDNRFITTNNTKNQLKITLK